MKKKKGFTIVELLMVLFIMSIIGLILIGNFGKNQYSTDEEQKNITNTNNLLSDALEIYYYLSMKNDTLSYYYNSSNELVSCIGIKTLISNGYLAEENFDATKYALLKVKNGQINYTLTTSTSACNYEEVSISGVYEGTSSSSGGTGSDVDSYSFSQTVSMVDVNTFNVDVDFQFQALIDYYFEDYKDTYVMMILDNSGSMSSSMMNSANSAVTILSQTLANNSTNNYKFCTGLITFNTNASLIQKFTNKAFTSNASAGGNTNYSNALNLAYTNIYETSANYAVDACKNSANTNSNVIIIFLSDGIPTDTGYVTVANKFKNKGAQILTIGYSVSATAKEKLQSFASNTCGTNKNSICYFDSNPATIAAQLKDFALTTIEGSKESNYKTGKVELTLNSDYFTFDSAGGSNVSYKNGVIAININLSEYDQSSGNFTGDYAFNINYNGKVGGSSVIEVPIFKEIYITFYDSAGKASQRVQITNLPKINLTKYNASAIN